MANIYKKSYRTHRWYTVIGSNQLRKKHKLNAKILAKLEYFNPAGSVKDRIAKSND